MLGMLVKGEQLRAKRQLGVFALLGRDRAVASFILVHSCFPWLFRSVLIIYTELSRAS